MVNVKTLYSIAIGEGYFANFCRTGRFVTLATLKQKRYAGKNRRRVKGHDG